MLPAEEDSMNVGFIGLGLMGGSMALNLQAAGHSLCVHDLRRESAAPHLAKGAVWKDSPRALAEACDVVFTSLPGPPEVSAVAAGADGLIHGMRRGGALFDLSTNSPAVIRRLHAQFKERGVEVLDAPVSGGPSGAKSRKLAIWVGGDKGTFDKHHALLEAMGDQPYYVGPIGAGAVAKLVHNCASFTIRAALAEVFCMGVKAGVAPELLWQAVRQGASGRARTFDRLADKFLSGSFDPPSFALKLGHKDVSLATELGREVGVPMRLANLALAEMTEAMNRGWADRDSSVYMLLEEERAGVKIAVPGDVLRKIVERDGA
jgi:3-hydroxyisobutyrate dehydrogenase-like beta-hydroxyacid dehydrogenase